MSYYYIILKSIYKRPPNSKMHLHVSVFTASVFCIYSYYIYYLYTCKILPKVLLNRLELQVDPQISKYQVGFRKGKLRIEQI